MEMKGAASHAPKPHGALSLTPMDKCEVEPQQHTQHNCQPHTQMKHEKQLSHEWKFQCGQSLINMRPALPANLHGNRKIMGQH